MTGLKTPTNQQILSKSAYCILLRSDATLNTTEEWQLVSKKKKKDMSELKHSNTEAWSQKEVDYC